MWKISAKMREEKLVCYQELNNIYKRAKERSWWKLSLNLYSVIAYLYGCDRTLNTEINRLHERALWIAYNDDISSFEDLLVKDGSLTIH